jgi:alcohol dehydrogenase class IV
MFDFSIARLPRIEFGAGSFNKLPEIIAGYGSSILMVTGGKSFRTSEKWHHLVDELNERGIIWEHCTVAEEPSPTLIDEIVQAFADYSFEVVVGIGGGSALDAAKAIAGLLKVQRSVMDYLEGVGPELRYEGPAVPFIAVPTTAGTGSEATKNAVLSVQGEHGFKKSFRHEMLVAEYAVVDPDLLSTCPPSVIAANGMDALTQLIESYVSLNANVFTDALAISGMRAARDGLLPLFEQSGQSNAGREKMAYAALISGITLAQVGLGSVHGLASPLGAFYPIPHGVVCGTLVASATEVNIKSMLERDAENRALDKYARVAEILCEKRIRDRQDAWDQLVTLLRNWTQQLQLPRLSYFGLNQEGLDKVVANSRGSSMKTNPIVLSDEEIKSVLLDRL